MDQQISVYYKENKFFASFAQFWLTRLTEQDYAWQDTEKLYSKIYFNILGYFKSVCFKEKFRVCFRRGFIWNLEIIPHFLKLFVNVPIGWHGNLSFTDCCPRHPGVNRENQAVRLSSHDILLLVFFPLLTFPWRIAWKRA